MNLELKRAITMVVGASIMVIMFSAVLVPIVNEGADSAVAKYNNVSNYFAMILPGDTGTVTGSIDADGVLTINDEVLTNTSQRYAIMGDTFYLRYSASAHTFNYWDSTTETMKNISGLPATFSASDGVLTYTGGSDTATVNYTWMAYNTNTESGYREIVATSSDKTVYINDKSDVYAVSKPTGINGLFSISAGEFNKTDSNDSGTLVFNTHPIDNVLGVDYFTLNTAGTSDLQYTFTVDDVDTAVFSGNILVPYEVKGIYDPPGSEFLTILNVIPIVVIIGIVLAVVGVAIVGRNDY